MTKQLFYTLDEAREVLRLKTVETVVKYGEQGRILIVGEKRNLLVSIASVEAYARGESAWHARKQQQSHPDASQEPAASGTRQAARSRSRRHSNSATATPGTITLLQPLKLRRTSTD